MHLRIGDRSLLFTIDRLDFIETSWWKCKSLAYDPKEVITYMQEKIRIIYYYAVISRGKACNRLFLIIYSLGTKLEKSRPLLICFSLSFGF